MWHAFSIDYFYILLFSENIKCPSNHEIKIEKITETYLYCFSGGGRGELCDGCTLQCDGGRKLSGCPGAAGISDIIRYQPKKQSM